MENIIKALVDAGYFRARISTLSDFDKVIGGFAWAMQVFTNDIDIDIFYKDTLDLGQKIALTERLVMVLIVMKCPHRIEPHQIVGLDYINLLPVVRWLIQRSLEVRREHEAFNRILALRHYFRVTNNTIDRSTWCHVLPLSQIQQLSSSRNVDNIKKERFKGSTDETRLLAGNIERDFKTNPIVSFVNLPSLMRASGVHLAATTQKILQDDSDRVSSNGEEEEEEQEVEEDKVRVEEKILASTITEPIEDNELELNRDNRSVVDESSSQEIIELHKELDTELLATNQKILNILRKLDSLPSSMEIIQYQRRYIELHQQLISKNKNVKKLFALFNSLDSIQYYLTKEINLLDSIAENLDLTVDSVSNRDSFARQLQDIIVKIGAVRDEVLSKLKVMRKRCDMLNAEYAKIIE